MNEPNLNQQNIGAALDAVKERHSRGELVGDQSISLTSALRQRLPDLKELNRDHSASAIASALTQEGFKVSASTVQRVLQEAPAKRKPRTAKETDSENIQTPEKLKSFQIPSKLPIPTVPLNSEALLEQMEQEDRPFNSPAIRRTAIIKEQTI